MHGDATSLETQKSNNNTYYRHIDATGDSTVIKDINFAHDNDEILRIGTVGTSDFGIGGMTCNSIWYRPVNRSFKKLSGARLINFQK